MASQQIIKRRIKSVSNTKQITKAMQLVAASKLRRAQEAALGPKAYIAAASELLSMLASTPEAHYHPFFEVRKNAKRALTIVITSDRGLAGAYNSNVNKALNNHTINLDKPMHAITIGRYATQHVARTKGFDEQSAFDLDVAEVDTMIVQPALAEAIGLFTEGKVDLVHIIYTKFVSTVKQEVTVEQLLPITGVDGINGNRTFEPEPDELLDAALNRLLEARLYQAVLEARASEQASRMLAMKNATDNAVELIGDLTLEYNNARQAAITQELAEITAGTEAING